MRRFRENDDYIDEDFDQHMWEIEDDFVHDVYGALVPVMRAYGRKRGVDPIKLLDRRIGEIIWRFRDEFPR